MRVVLDFDELEDSLTGFGMVPERSAVKQLVRERREEALCPRVIEAVTYRQKSAAVQSWSRLVF